MALIRALNSAISGIKGQQTRIDVIGDNLANVNTFGFKTARVQFATLLSQTIRDGTAPAGNLGGIDPIQIGLGQRLGQISKDFSQGNLVATGRNTDLAIEGEGFYELSDQDGNLVYSRYGAFSVNPSGKLHDPSTGSLVLGTPVDSNFNLTGETGKSLEVLIGSSTPAKATSTASFQGNLNGGGELGTDGTVLQSEVLQFDTTGDGVSDGTILLTTNLTDLGKAGTSGFVDFNLATGSAITIKAKKGGRQLSTQTFTVGDQPPKGGTTVEDLIDFIGGMLAIQENNAVGQELFGAQRRDTTNVVMENQLVTGDTVTAGTGNPRTVTIRDASFDFVTNGVQVGDFLRVATGKGGGAVGRITAVGTPSGLADNFTIQFEDESANTAIALNDIYAIHEAADIAIGGTGTGSATNPQAKFDPASAAGVMRVSANAGKANEIADIEVVANNTTLFTFSQAIAAKGEGTHTRSIFFDSLGTQHAIDMTYVLQGKADTGNVWRWFAETDDSQSNPGVDLVRGVGTGTVVFKTDGSFSSQANQAISVNLASTGATTPLNVTADHSKVSGFTSITDANGNVLNNSSVSIKEQDGFTGGTLRDFAVASDGVINGIYSNGKTQALGRVLLKRFNNPNGLIDLGNNMFRASVNSGNGAPAGTPGVAGRGLIRGGFLEESNVELSEEFTNLIVSQRAFQANARVISASNEVLRDLVNIV